MGCGIVGVLVLLCIIGGVIYIRSHPEAFTDFLIGRIEASYSSDVTEQDKADLRAAYAQYREKLRARSVSGRSLDRVRTVLVRGGGAGSTISRDQVHELTAAFRDAAGNRDPGVPAVVITPPPVSSGTPGPLASPTP
jgi:hypothetical protein